MFSSRRRKLFVGLGTVAALAVGAIAVAFFTGADGSGTGSATVGSSTAWGVSVTGTPSFTPSGYTAIYPGAGVELVPFTVTNNGKGNQNLNSLSYAIKNDGGSPANAETSSGTVLTGCLASWFTASNDAGNGALPSDLATGGTYAGKVDVALSDLSTTNQDACQGKSPGVTVTASSS